jgi:multidrug resistance efflux pump
MMARSDKLGVALAIAVVVIVVSALVPMDIEVTGEAILRPTGVRLLVPEVSGSVARVPVSQGQRVRAGDLLLQLDPTRLRASLVEERAALRQAEEALALAARGPRPEEIAAVEAQVALSHRQMEYADDELDRGAAMFAPGLITEVELESIRHRLALAKGHHDAAERELDLLRAGLAAEEIAQRRAQVEELQSRVSQAERNLQATELRAPLDGVVTTENPDHLVGTFVGRGTHVLTLHTGPPEAVVSVREREIADVRVAQPVRLKAQSYPDEVFSGQVRAIAPLLQPAASQGLEANVAQVRVRLDGHRELLRAGMTGQARILCGERSALSLFLRRIKRWLKLEFWW